MVAAGRSGQALQRGRHFVKTLNVSFNNATGHQRLCGATLQTQPASAGRRQLDPAQAGCADVQADQRLRFGLKKCFQKVLKYF
jgi:hypothetical protein